MTGARRGIGYKLVEQIAARPDTIVFAGVRSLPVNNEDELGKLIERLPNTVFPIELRSGNEEDHKEAAQLVEAKVGKVDVIIANAGKYSFNAAAYLNDEHEIH